MVNQEHEELEILRESLAACTQLYGNGRTRTDRIAQRAKAVGEAALISADEPSLKVVVAVQRR